MTRIPLTAREIVDFLRCNDVGSPIGKRGLWRLFRGFSPLKGTLKANRDAYLEIGHDIEESNRFAVLDVASDLPSGGVSEEDLELSRSQPSGSYPTEADLEVGGGASLDVKVGNLEKDIIAGIAAIVRARRRGGDSLDLGDSLIDSWVATELGTDWKAINVGRVPGLAALWRLRWAKENETLWRQLYDSKPSAIKNEAGKSGFVDDGEPIASMIAQIEEAREKHRSTANVSM